MTLAENIRFYREKIGMYQADLGKALGVSAQAISKWELGKAEPDRESILKMCELFEVSADELLGRDPGIKKEPAPPGGMRESVMRLFDEIEAAGLSDAEAEYIRTQIEGIKALRKPG